VTNAVYLSTFKQGSDEFTKGVARLKELWLGLKAASPPHHCLYRYEAKLFPLGETHRMRRHCVV